MSDPPGLSAFIQEQSPGLLRFAWALSGNWSTAEDLVQTALAATWPRWDSLVRSDRPELHVRKVIVTTYLRWQRRRWSHEIPTAAFQDVAGRSDPAAADTRSVLIEVLKRLPPKQRAVLVVSYFLDLSEADAARMLDCSVGTIKRQKHVALDRLRAEPELATILDGKAP